MLQYADMDTNVLLKTRCSKGHLIVYGDRVAIEHSTLGDNTLLFSKVTGCQIQVKAAAIPILSKGLATVKVFTQGNQELVADLVTVADAKKAKELIEARIA